MIGAVRVIAGFRFNDTGIDVQAGQQITMTAPGTWTDWTIKTDADGFERDFLRPTACFRRLPETPWFRLCASIGKTDANAFAIGRTASVTAPATGRLFLFANDISIMYWNNRGELLVSITLHPAP